MGRKLIAQLLPVLEKMSFSGTEALTPNGYTVFEVGRDRVDGYRGDPRTLGEALRTFRTADSLPYEYGGVAYTLVAASREEDGSYDQTGLETALAWVEKAQELAPDATDINVVEAFVYIYGDRLDDARLVLDYLQEQEPGNYYVARAEIDYWRARHNAGQAIQWSERAMHLAQTVPQRLRLKSIVADIHSREGNWDEALKAYREATHFDPDNGWLWYAMARIHWQRNDVEEARRLNEKALRLDPELEEAHALQEKIEEASGDRGKFLGRLFGS